MKNVIEISSSSESESDGGAEVVEKVNTEIGRKVNHRAIAAAVNVSAGLGKANSFI